MLKVRAHVYIHGKVQGVAFRMATRGEAIMNNVTGWVRNLSDGRVEAVFEGEKENVEKLIRFCRNGPPKAYVTRLEVSWETYTGRFEYFNKY
ncbi:MAG: acylphosphatase [Candidatus Hodarchaeota archaeon]